MSKALLLPGLVFLSTALASVMAQETVKPLSQSELGRLPSLGTGSTSRSPLGAADALGADTVKPSKNKVVPEKGKAGVTEITSEEASFDQKSHMAIFNTKVFVKNPDFTLSSDKLTAYMKAQKGALPDPGALKSAPPVLSNENGSTQLKAAAPKGPATGKSDGGGLERAVAEGNVIITRETLDADGSVQRSVGRGRKAVYESSTGDLILTGKPEADQGTSTIVATSEETVMTMNRNGKFNVQGPNRVVLRENVSLESGNGR